MTKNELLQKLDELHEHEDCADFKLALDVAIEAILHQTDLAVFWAYRQVVEDHEQ